MSRTLLHSLLETHSRQKQQVAARYVKNGKWQTLSWQDYFLKCQQIGAALLQLGVEAGDRIAIYGNSRIEWAVSDVGALGIGTVTIPIYHSNIPQDVEFILNNSEAKILFVENQTLLDRWFQISESTPNVKWIISFEVTNSTDERVLQFSKLLEIGEKKLTDEPDSFVDLCKSRKRSELATIVYTSGTTGTPKGVMITHEQIMSEIEDVFTVLDVSDKDISLTFLPFAHIFGRIEHFGHIHVGFCMGYAESIDRIKNGLIDIKPTFMAAVPRIFEKVYNGIISQAEAQPTKKKIFHWALKIGYQVSDARTQRRTLPLTVLLQYQLARKLVFDKIGEKLGGRLRFAISGGAPLSKEIGRFFHAANVYVLEGYGLTETTAAIFVNSLYDYRFGTVGKAVGDVKIRIADDGEILIKSKKIMLGYYKNSQATKEVLSDDGWFATGDIGELSSDGFLRITDRKKDLIKTAGGKFIAPQKLENLLKLNKYISNVLIHGDKRKFVVALVTVNFEEVNRLAEDHGITTRDHAQLVKNSVVKDVIRQAVAEANSQLASYESIKSFEILPEDFTIESGELTPSLKVKRKFCDQKYAPYIDKLYGEETAHELTTHV